MHEQRVSPEKSEKKEASFVPYTTEIAHALRRVLIHIKELRKEDIEERWFEQPNGALWRIQEYINRLPGPSARLLLPFITVLNTTCEHTHSESQDFLSQDSAVRFQAKPHAVELEFVSVQNPDSVQATIHIHDVNRPEDWDKDLTPLHDIRDITENALYQFHVNILREQLETSSLQNASLNTITNVEFKLGKDSSGIIKKVAMKHHRYEGARSGFYAPISEQLAIFSPYDFDKANMEIEDPHAFIPKVIHHAQQYAEQNAWGDPEDLTAWQWIQVIDNFNVDQPYDPLLASSHPSFDSLEAERVNALPVDKLVDREQGAVCRDFLREQLIAYTIYSQEYALQDRGLLMLPVTRFSDAAHARALFVIAQNDRDITVVATDTTNTRDRSLFPEDSAENSAAIWYAQNIAVKSWLPPDIAHDFYFLMSTTDGMFPTTRAIAQRESIIASLQEASYLSDVNPQEAKSKLIGAFNDLNTRLSMSSMNDTDGVYSPQQMVPLFDLLVGLGTVIDTDYEAQALASFLQYCETSGLNTDDLKIYRSKVEQINRIPLRSGRLPEQHRANILSMRARLGL